MPNRSIDSIKCQAKRLSISPLKQRENEEDRIIREYYPILGSDIYKRLGNKTKKQCRHRANTMGVYRIRING